MTKDEQVWNEFMGEDDFDSLSIHNKSLIKGIMSSYAKQQAIAFLKRHITFSDTKIYEEMYNKLIEDQFIEQQNKNNG